MVIVDKKINVIPQVWDHSHGWTAASMALQALHTPDGVTCFMSVEDQVFLSESEPPPRWVGFTHMPPYTPTTFSLEYNLNKNWHIKRRLAASCVGLFCLGTRAADFLKTWVDCPVSMVPHPTAEPSCKFSLDAYFANPDPMIVTVGHVSRDFQAVAAFRQARPRPAVLDCGIGGDYWYNQRFNRPLRGVNPAVEILSWKMPAEYDQLLSNNIVFLPLKDSVACNAIVECVVRATPVLVTRVGGNEEYLGKDYPGFYESVPEAARLAGDSGWVRAAHEHLAGLDVSWLSLAHFAEAVATSEVYRLL